MKWEIIYSRPVYFVDEVLQLEFFFRTTKVLGSFGKILLKIYHEQKGTASVPVRGRVTGTLLKGTVLCTSGNQLGDDQLQRVTNKYKSIF